MIPIDPESARTLIKAGALAAAASPVMKTIVGKMFGPSLDAIGTHLGEKTKSFLQRNVTATVERAADMVAATGQDPREIPLKDSLAILEGAAREDDPDLRERWAALLANAAVNTDTASSAKFAQILSRLTPLDARLIDFLAQGIFGPGSVIEREYRRHDISGYLNRDEIGNGAPKVTKEAADIAVDTIVSLGLATELPRFKVGKTLETLGEFEHEEQIVTLSSLGHAFRQACAAPAAAARD